MDQVYLNQWYQFCIVRNTSVQRGSLLSDNSSGTALRSI